MKITDWVSGYLSVRHHVKNDVDLALRNVPKLCRSGTRDLGAGPGRDDIGIEEPEQKDLGGDEDTVGDLAAGATLWGITKGAKDDREIPGWSLGGWASMITSPKPSEDDAAAEAPTTRARPTTTGSSSSASTQEKPLDKGRPARKKGWTKDERYEEKKLSTPFGITLPKLFPGITISGSEERTQEDLFAPGGGILVAPHMGGRKEFGTLVFDVTADEELDSKRKAHLQSLARVYETPTSPVQGLFGPPEKHGLALQLGRPLEGFPGLGLYADEPAGGGGGLKTVSGGPSGKRPQTIAPLSRRASGPLHPGFGASDAHFLGANKDGDQFSAGGIDVNAYFVMAPGVSGPLDFGGSYVPGKDFPILTNVYLQWDAKAPHAFVGGQRLGRWKWISSSPLYVPPPPTDGPDPKTPRRPPPPNIPVIPGIPVIGEDPKTPKRPPPPPPPTTPGIPGIPVNPGIVPEDGGGGDGSTNVIEEIDTTGLVDDGETTFNPGENSVIEGFTDGPFDPRENGPEARTQPRNLDYMASWMELAAPSFMIRPQHFSTIHADLRNKKMPTPEELRQIDRKTPMIVQIEGVGAQDGDGWNYTTKPGQGRYGGGTANGTVNCFPPELGFEQVKSNTEPTNVSDVAFNFYRTSLTHGKPEERGWITDGFEWVRSGDGSTLTLNGIDADGAVEADIPLEIDRTAQEVRAFGVTLGGGGSTETPGWAGCGGDGAFDLDGTNTYASYMSKSGSTYTLSADIAATTFVVRNGSTLKTNGFRIYAKTSFEVESGGLVKNDGNDGESNGTGAGGAAAGTPGQGTLATSGAGGAAGSNGSLPTPNTSAIGGNGGNGTNAGSGGTAGTGANCSGSFNANRGTYKKYSVASSGIFDGGSPGSNSPVACGGGGGGGGNGKTAGQRAGGGSGGGFVLIVTPTLTVGGTIQANGGNGGAAGGSTDDGGGGGGGGVVFLVYRTKTGAGSITANGGTKGSASATNGGAGVVLECTPP